MEGLENLNDIISSLSSDDIDMLKGVASSILGQEEQNPPPSIAPPSNNKQSLSLDNIDYSMILKAKQIFDRMNNTSNKNADLILALKPHLSPETQNKADQAIRILKLFEILPFIKELF